MEIQSFTKGKSEPKNEDAFGSNDTTIVVTDGATDKSGQSFDGKTGGEIISKLLVEKTLASSLDGVELVSYLTDEVRNLYQDINPQALNDSKFRFAATLVCVRLVEDKVHVTQVGDTCFRINGNDLYENNKLIDELNAEARSLYIERTGDVDGSRDYILPILKQQHEYQNNSEFMLGYGAIDGTEVPGKFVRTFEFPKNNVQTIEIITDGYFSVPDEISIDAYEREYERIEKEDPDKYKIYKSTKSKDDRTVIIATL